MRFRRQRGRYAARHHVIEQIARSEERRICPQKIFLERGELCKSEGKTSIIAQRSEIAEMICEPFVFESEGAQVRCSRRARGFGNRFEGRAIRPGERDGRISRCAGRQPMSM